MEVSMFTCRMCGKEFNLDEAGHVDDHVEICRGCFPKFQEKMQLKTAIKNLGKHLASIYRAKMCREVTYDF